jgi:hypothetical protein
MEAIDNFYFHLQRGEWEKLLKAFPKSPLIHTPMSNVVDTPEKLQKFVKKQQQWLSSKSARSEIIDKVKTETRYVVEFVLYLEYADEVIDLPVAVVADKWNQDILAIRVYHSTWPLTGKHKARKPILQHQPNLSIPSLIEKYMSALNAGDVARVIDLFAADGYVREPSGARYKHFGEQGLQHFYGNTLKNGGIHLKHCTVVYDGKCCAVEFICDRWGTKKIPPQAGMAVYELGQPSPILAARIYDDIEAPEH